MQVIEAKIFKHLRGLTLNINMVEFPNLADPQAIFAFANTQTAGGWLGIGIDLILSTLVGGIVLIILAEVFSHAFGESIKPQNAFLISLIGNIVNLAIVIFGFAISVPMAGVLVPLLVWFILMKAFFKGMKIFHTFLVALIFFMLTILLIPTLVSMVMGFIPIGL